MIDKITGRSARVVVVGGGYVGLPLAVEIAKTRFHTTVYDKDTKKIESLKRGVSYIADVSELPASLNATSDPSVLADADVIVICVPTPLNKTRDPDNSFILSAADELAAVAYQRMISFEDGKMLHKQLIVLESTTFPGFTREVLLPKLSQSMKLDETLFLAFSPERVDPGNHLYKTANTPKIVGGVSPTSTSLAQAFYSTFIKTVVPVSSADAAEMTKLLENTYRAVNIGLVNEIAIMCRYLGLDTREIIDAAKTKPFGFQAFYPGPGVGGHCIGPDPLYLSWKLKTLNYNARFITLADEMNCAMPEYVVGLVAGALNDDAKSVKNSKILVCGVAYKKNIDDVRESPALDVITLLKKRGAFVAYADAHVTEVRGVVRASMDDAADYDCVVITTDHNDVDYDALAARASLIVDTRGVLRGKRHRARIVSL